MRGDCAPHEVSEAARELISIVRAFNWQHPLARQSPAAAVATAAPAIRTKASRAGRA